MDNKELLDHKLIRETNGKLLKTILNLVNCFYVDENLKDLFIFNEFSGTVEYSREAIWHGVKKGQELRDKDIVFVQYYLAHNKDFEMPIPKITNALIELAERNRYHPIKNYLQELFWDGQNRLDEWLVNVCGADNNTYTRAIGSKFLMGAVARIYQPGIKFDNVLILEGEENIGKSTVFRILSDPWFCDSVDLMQDDKQIIEKMRGSWFLEMAELVGMNDRDQEWVTSFLSRQEDVQRLSYERRAEKFKRQSVFCASSNKMDYLYRAEGNRRWWPVKCNKIDFEYLKINKDQIFAEARDRWQRGEDLFLSQELFQQAKLIQKEKLNVNEVWFEIIEKYLLNQNETTMKNVLFDCLKVEVKEMQNRSYITNVGRVLKKLGFEKKQRVNQWREKFVYVREDKLGEIEEKRLFNEEVE
jgi:predicted P-loop ATPase